jgi:hypothetical protein
MSQSISVSSPLQQWSRAVTTLFSQKSPTENLLLELNNVRKIVCREASYLQNPLVDEEKKRKRLNFLFVKDLLDGVNGMIMDHKDRRDNEMVTHRVEAWHKVLACLLLFGTSFGMLYYVYLFSMRQSASRQRAWFNSFQVWLFFEVCVISTGLVFVEHVLIPLWSLREVQRVKERIVSDILTFQKKVKKMNSKSKSGSNTNKRSHEEEPSESDPSSFNAAEFLFPSHRLAVLFPEYPESALILRYKTPWPKKSFKQGEKSMRKRYDKRFEFVAKTVARVVVFVVSSIVQLPPSLQDLGIQVTLLALCGWIVRCHLRLYRISPVLVALPSLLVATVVYVLFVSGRKARNLISRTYPVQDEKEEDDEDDENDKDDDKDKGNEEGDALGKGLNEEKDGIIGVRTLDGWEGGVGRKEEGDNKEEGVGEEKNSRSRSDLVRNHVAVSRGVRALQSLSLAERIMDGSVAGSESEESEDGDDLSDPLEWAELGMRSSGSEGESSNGSNSQSNSSSERFSDDCSESDSSDISVEVIVRDVTQSCEFSGSGREEASRTGGTVRE